MPRLTFDIELPALMHRELIERCQLCRCSPKQYASECLEATLAGIRLPRVEAGTHGPQLGPRGSERQHEEEDDLSVLSPSHIPTVDDLEGLCQ